MDSINMADISDINAELEMLHDRHFASVENISKDVESILAAFEIGFPGIDDSEEDYIFKIETAEGDETEYYLYVIVDPEPVGFSVFAQILEWEDIIDIQEVSLDVGLDVTDFLTRVRHSADD